MKKTDLRIYRDQELKLFVFRDETLDRLDSIDEFLKEVDEKYLYRQEQLSELINELNKKHEQQKAAA